ncbi:MAG: hypothetical protein NXI04_12500 [Planctomycetaceae bacterium]|nr:hypothetical protein [Planctomycetaceae bacterium]
MNRPAFVRCAACCSFLLLTTASMGQEQTTRPQLSLSFYPLGELATGLLSPDEEMSAATPVMGGVSGSVSPLGGGGSSGGGMFSLPTQFGGGGFSGSGGAMQAGVASIARFDLQHQTLIELIQTHVAPESWESNGGDGTIEAVNNTLLIQQSQKNHTLVTSFLKQLHANVIGGAPVNIEAWWIPVNDEQKAGLTKLLAAANPDARQQLNAYCRQQQGYHGSVRTKAGMKTSLRSGGEKRVVTSVVPVVGTGAIGHQPVISTIPLGLDAIITTDVIPQWEGSGLRLRVHSALTSLSDYTPRSDEESVDRYQLNRISLTTTLTCESAKPVIAGSLTAIDADQVNASSETELVLVVLATVHN